MQHSNTACCILLKFYIKPQPSRHRGISVQSCILSKFHIKPQQNIKAIVMCYVVSYRNSTSNHNWLVVRRRPCVLYLIEILHQTTTCDRHIRVSHELYLIEILHQTTTGVQHRRGANRLYLIEILHQTTTGYNIVEIIACCILSKFYIKPQLQPRCR